MKALRRSSAVLVTLLLFSASPTPSRAHTEPYSWVDVRIAGPGWTGRVTAHVEDLAFGIGLATPDSLLQAAYVTRHAAALEQALAVRLHLEADGDRVRPRWTGVALVPERNGVAFDFRGSDDRPPSDLRLRGPLFTHDPTHATYFNVYVDGAIRRQDLLDSGRTESRFTTGFQQRHLDVVRRFVAEGIHHIFIGPDHILFIIGLLLLGGSLGRLLKIITAFTLAHSVTLALAALGLVRPPARLVEPAIALSIIYVGAANLMSNDRRQDRRALLAGCFGLVHGFGFANVLRELGLPREALVWSLFSFNVGVEIGQACIVLAVAPLLALLRARRPALALRTVHLVSLAVVASGAYWFVQRAFLS
jgi:hydrogenase/urease accessory protein HupE